MKTVTLGELADRIGGDLVGDPGLELTGVAPLHTASGDQVSFLASPRYAPSLETTRAGAVIVTPDQEAPGLNLIRVKDPYFGFALAMEVFHLEPYSPTGVSPQAFVDPKAAIGPDPSIHPCAVVCEGAVVGARVTLMPGCYVGPGAEVGDDSVLHPNAVVEKGVVLGKRVTVHAGTVIGSDGFGYAREKGRYRKIIQAGTVVVEDDVEIGANSAIDRAVMGETVIGRGSKIDNLVQVAHNVVIGQDCALAGQAGIAGSTVLGDGVAMAGQTGVVGHVKVGPGAVILAKSAVFKDVPDGARVGGIPAVDVGEWRKSSVLVGRLDELRKRVIRMEKRLAEMRGAGAGEEEESE